MSARPRGFVADWRQVDTLALLDQVMAVLDEYAEQLPLTLRQILYRLVGACLYENIERAYKRLTEALNKARRARLVPMVAIRDDRFTHPEDALLPRHRGLSACLAPGRGGVPARPPTRAEKPPRSILRVASTASPTSIESAMLWARSAVTVLHILYSRCCVVSNAHRKAGATGC